MSSSIFGKTLDIHSGGIDLRFPHHDNEIAQTEAHDDSKQWINYFLHTGHLKIEGLKMSKSLKNFKKITDFINLYTPNAFRLYFCNSKWDCDMDFTENGLSMASANDKKIAEFFQNVKVWARENDLKKDLKFNEEDNKLNTFFEEVKKNVHNSFCDNFNTPGVVSNILELIRSTYEYQEKSSKAKNLKLHLIYTIAKFISDIIKCLGLVYNTDFVDYFRLSEGDAGKNAEEILSPFMDIITKFRHEVKNAIVVEKDEKKILKLCDQLRDETLPELGVRIEDKGNEGSLWKFFDKEQYKKEKEKEKELKENKKKQKEEEAKQREMKLSMTAKEYYATMTDKYSAFDEEGIPIKNAKGNDISKEQYNKLKKEFAKHDKQHQKWLEQQNKKKEGGNEGEKKDKKKKKKEKENKEENNENKKETKEDEKAE